MSNLWLKFKVYRHVLKKSQIDIIHFHDTLIDNLIGIYGKLINGKQLSIGYTAPFIDMKKTLAEESQGLEYLYRKIWYFIFKYIYIFSFKTSDHIFPITNSLANRMHSTYRLDEEKLLPLGESASSHFLSFTPNIEKVSKKLKIIYVGSMRKTRNLEFLLDSFCKVLIEFPNADLDMLGWSEFEEDVEALKRLSDKLGIEKNVNFIDKQPYHNVPEFILDANVGVSPIPPTAHFFESTPTKVIEYLSLGIPVVSNMEIKDQHNVVTKSKGGLSVKYDSDEFSKAIIKLLKSPLESKKIGLRGREWIIKNRTFRKTAELIESKFESSL